MVTNAGQRDYYDVLGVARDADAKRIKDAFRELALKYHPDRNKSPDAETRFKEIAEAYAVLSDPAKRAEYDARGFAGVAGFTPEDLFGGIDFDDIFRDVAGDLGFGFGLGGPGSVFDRLFRHRRAGPVRGADVEVELVVPLERIASGGEETLRYARTVGCPACHGTGAKGGAAPRPCPACGGSGQKVVTRDERKAEGAVRIQQISTCPVCHGKGARIETPCPGCQGAGQVGRDERLTVTVPRGAEEGLALRVPRHGAPSGEAGGSPGDLYVVVRSQTDPRFERVGADLWRVETIGVAEAALGTKRKVATLDGAIEATIPPGTQPEEVLRVRGKGLPRFGSPGRGDLNLRVRVQVPERLSRRERALYQELQALQAERVRTREQ